MRTLLSFLLILSACDPVGQWGTSNDPACAVRVVAGQGTTPPGIQPWVAVEVAGKEDCPVERLVGVDVSLFEVESAEHRGKGILSSYKKIPGDPDNGFCAIFTWPESARVGETWAVAVIPPTGIVTGFRPADEVPLYAPGIFNPSFRDLNTGEWHLWWHFEETPSCIPPWW